MRSCADQRASGPHSFTRKNCGRGHCPPSTMPAGSERVALLAPTPEDRLVGLDEITDVAQQAVEHREIFRRFGALDGEQDVSLERVRRHRPSGRRSRDLRLEARDAPLATGVNGGEPARVEIRQRTDGDGERSHRQRERRADPASRAPAQPIRQRARTTQLPSRDAEAFGHSPGGDVRRSPATASLPPVSNDEERGERSAAPAASGFLRRTTGRWQPASNTERRDSHRARAAQASTARSARPGRPRCCVRRCSSGSSREGTQCAETGRGGLRRRTATQTWFMRDAATAAPNPLSMLTTVTPAAQLFSIVSSARHPPKDAP